VGKEDKFDAIIVGAGPAGTACAYTLAKAGKSVLLIERGTTAGSKNVTGGRLYTYALDVVKPGLWQEAQLERRVTHEELMLIDGDRAISIDYHDPSFSRPGERPQSFTVLRASFDEWFAAKAEEAGAILACGIRVDGLVEENGRIVGVLAGEDDMYADTVIAADGVNSFIAQKAGLVKDVTPRDLGVGVKEIIELPSAVIEERFHLNPGEGSARMMLGCSRGIHGGGFLYTNKESVSLGVVLRPDQVAAGGRSVHDIFQDLKTHPALAPLLAGGETVEYGAHLVREAGYRGVPEKLYRDGLLVIGEAAGFLINTGYSIRGIDLAIVSGVAAARACLSSGDPGPAYRAELDALKLLESMRAVDGFTNLMQIERLYATYPSVAAQTMCELYSVDGSVPKTPKRAIRGVLQQQKLSLWQLAKDGIRGWRSL